MPTPTPDPCAVDGCSERPGTWVTDTRGRDHVRHHVCDSHGSAWNDHFAAVAVDARIVPYLPTIRAELAVASTPAADLCLIPGCGGKRHARGLCSRCYSKHYAAGTLDDVAPPADPVRSAGAKMRVTETVAVATTRTVETTATVETHAARATPESTEPPAVVLDVASAPEPEGPVVAPPLLTVDVAPEPAALPTTNDPVASPPDPDVAPAPAELTPATTPTDAERNLLLRRTSDLERRLDAARVLALMSHDSGVDIMFGAGGYQHFYESPMDSILARTEPRDWLHAEIDHVLAEVYPEVVRRVRERLEHLAFRPLDEPDATLPIPFHQRISAVLTYLRQNPGWHLAPCYIGSPLADLCDDDDLTLIRNEIALVEERRDGAGWTVVADKDWAAAHPGALKTTS